MSAKAKKVPFFEKFATYVTHLAGTSTAFAFSFVVILCWFVTGPFFNYSDTWQLIINTSTTIITFLMVFIIQKSQNKEAKSTQLKLNELIAAIEKASNRLVNVEDLTEDELNTLKKHYIHLAKTTQREEHLRESHSIEEAEKKSQRKIATKGKSAEKK